MQYLNQKERIEAAYKLLQEETSSYEKFDSIRQIVSGLNPKVDKLLASLDKNLSIIKNLKEGNIIELSAQTLPETTEKEKRRKKFLILFIRNFQELRNEVERIKNQLNNQQTQGNTSNIGKILIKARGPFGIITIIAIASVVILTYVAKNSETSQSTESKNPDTQTQVRTINQKMKVITFNGKKIPLTEIQVSTGPDCNANHYHAVDHTKVKALDNSIINDPGSCGFGKVNETLVEDYELK